MDEATTLPLVVIETDLGSITVEIDTDTEHHPDDPAPNQTLLRRLSAELMESWGW